MDCFSGVIKMYQLIKNFLTGETNMVKRLADNAFIPMNPDNTDYQAYLRWLEAGNTPEPAEENQ
jgi:hypothetical protein